MKDFLVVTGGGGTPCLTDFDWTVALGLGFDKKMLMVNKIDLKPFNSKVTRLNSKVFS